MQDRPGPTSVFSTRLRASSPARGGQDLGSRARPDICTLSHGTSGLSRLLLRRGSDRKRRRGRRRRVCRVAQARQPRPKQLGYRHAGDGAVVVCLRARAVSGWHRRSGAVGSGEVRRHHGAPAGLARVRAAVHRAHGQAQSALDPRAGGRTRGGACPAGGSGHPPPDPLLSVRAAPAHADGRRRSSVLAARRLQQRSDPDRQRDSADHRDARVTPVLEAEHHPAGGDLRAADRKRDDRLQRAALRAPRPESAGHVAGGLGAGVRRPALPAAGSAPGCPHARRRDDAGRGPRRRCAWARGRPQSGGARAVEAAGWGVGRKPGRCAAVGVRRYDGLSRPGGVRRAVGCLRRRA